MAGAIAAVVAMGSYVSIQRQDQSDTVRSSVSEVLSASLSSR